MSIFWQNLIVGVVVLAALVYLGRWYYYRRKKKSVCRNCPVNLVSARRLSPTEARRPKS